jgi:hypothetical protein
VATCSTASGGQIEKITELRATSSARLPTGCSPASSARFLVAPLRPSGHHSTVTSWWRSCLATAVPIWPGCRIAIVCSSAICSSLEVRGMCQILGEGVVLTLPIPFDLSPDFRRPPPSVIDVTDFTKKRANTCDVAV